MRRAGLLLITLPACLACLVGQAIASPTHLAEILSTPAPLGDPTLTSQREGVVVLQPWEATRAEELKSADPSITLLAYQNLGAIAQGRGPGGSSSSGVNYDEANASHPEWFLQESSGARIAEEGFPWLWMADIGQPTYQQQWTANVIKLLQGGPWDGVLMDDTNLTPRYHVEPQSRIAKYPDDTDYQAAVRSMLAYAGPRIQAAGKLAIPNIGAWTQYPEVAREWLAYVSGGEDEMFVKYSSVPGEGYRSATDFKTQLEEVRTTEDMGKRFLAVTQAEPADTQAMRYGWASAMLAGNGGTAFLAAPSYEQETWSAEYEGHLGEPLAPASEIGAGVWARRFQDGLVLVNPAGATAEVSLGGSYSGDGLSEATSTELPPDHALILLLAATEAGSAPIPPGDTQDDGEAPVRAPVASTPPVRLTRAASSRTRRRRHPVARRAASRRSRCTSSTSARSARDKRARQRARSAHRRCARSGAPA